MIYNFKYVSAIYLVDENILKFTTNSVDKYNDVLTVSYQFVNDFNTVNSLMSIFAVDVDKLTIIPLRKDKYVTNYFDS